MDDEERLDAGARVAVLEALLKDHSVATVGALGEDGRSVPWPGSLPLGARQIVQARSTFEITAVPDHAVVLGAFREVLVAGVGQTRARRAGDPDRWLHLHYVDVREGHGVIARVVVGDGDPSAFSEAPVESPRFGTIRQSPLGVIIDCDESYAAMWGGCRDDLIGRVGIDLIHPDDRETAIDAWIAMYATGHGQRVRFRGIRKDGSLSWREVTIHNEPGDPARADVVAEVVDISNEVAAHDTIRAQELRLNRMAQAVPVGLFEIDGDRRIVYANDRLHEILGTAPTETLGDLLATIVAEDQPRVDAALASALAAAGDVDVDAEIRVPATGEPRRCQLSVRAVSDPLERVIGAIVCVSDVTEAARARVELERDLIQHAFHDPLTGLANRTLLINRTEEAVDRATASGELVAIVLADLDGFKAVNDSLGHVVGDEILRQASDRLRSVLAAGDTGARVGGDEFVVLLQGFLDPERPRRIAEQILFAMGQPFVIDGRVLEIGACIGIATSAAAPGTEELLRDADLALHRARSNGPGCYETFAAEMHEAVLARVELEASLRHALDADELVVFYQPIHGLGSRRVTSVEALVRWRHPTRGLVPPTDFIPLAEDTGLIVPIGLWVLEQACAEAASWPDLAGVPPPGISVNLSARQLARDTIVDDVAGALSRSGLDPARLVLEITESLLVDEDGGDGASTRIAQLDELGVGLAIDDFGTGYSSLAYLQDLPVDVLKIDRAFVSRLASGGRHVALIEGIIRLAQSLDLRTVAEGVETIEQLHTLEALGCDGAQGYLFSRPVDADHLRDHLRRSAAPDARDAGRDPRHPSTPTSRPHRPRHHGTPRSAPRTRSPSSEPDGRP
jgi:diguanylate cyclase (GGDEF)-like protein/PAS domain S-box-containing protein